MLIYGISYKTFMGPNPLRIRFDEKDGFITIYDGIKYLVLFGFEQYDALYNRIRYLISEKIILIIILQESELIHLILYL